jgi:aspartate kinase
MGAELLAAVARTGTSVEMLSYGLNSINFSMVIDNADIGRVVPVLHKMLIEDRGHAG